MMTQPTNLGAITERRIEHVPPNPLLMAQLELSGKETDAARAERDAMAAELKALRERSGAAEIDREKVRDAIAEALGDMIFCCTRQWSAWGYGTMSQNDFVLASEDDGILDELTDAAVSAIDHAIATAGAPS